ncbi:MAG TPA: hypothetical protein VMV34_10160 [Terriglobia bacterium]|nr:hypothetical protein [Terriglobia bacterium]
MKVLNPLFAGAVLWVRGNAKSDATKFPSAALASGVGILEAAFATVFLTHPCEKSLETWRLHTAQAWKLPDPFIGTCLTGCGKCAKRWRSLGFSLLERKRRLVAATRGLAVVLHDVEAALDAARKNEFNSLGIIDHPRTHSEF